jgi:hypothetical protein
MGEGRSSVTGEKRLSICVSHRKRVLCIFVTSVTVIAYLATEVTAIAYLATEVTAIAYLATEVSTFLSPKL